MKCRTYAGVAGVSVLAIVASLQFSSDAHAANCSSKGGLLFVGKTAGNANSVWLSGTSAGSFRLDAQGGTVDTWTESRRGLHLTLSNVVSTGNGGTHHLYDNSGAGCLLDSQNQKGGVNLPPIGDLFPDFVMPERPGNVTPPIATLPPTGLMPGLPPGFSPPIGVLPPPEGLMPGLPPTGGVQLPGSGVTPPIGTVPPEGMMPTLPPTGGVQLPGGGVTPPIGTVPPEGVMPTLPPTGGVQLPGGGVTPPIGTVPPEGVMPTLPPTGGVQLPGGGVTPPIGRVPPEGVMPTLPPTGGVQLPGGSVTPPIGTVPPEGVMPTLPPTGGVQLPGGGVTPPIGTVPPEGVMPTLPPTGGVQLPGGGVTPPIGTVPPEGVMPTLPPTGGVQLPGGGVTPPIGTVPPEGVMPTLPPTGGVQLPGGGVTPPIGTVPPEGVMPTLPPTGGVQLPGGGVTPPIGTVPPEGVMPTLPPTGGVQLPGGGVTPPIGIVPPEGVTPERPSLGGGQLPGGNITPPIGTLPPDGLTPTVPTVPPTNPPTTVTPTAPGVTQTVANAQITKGGAAFLPNDNCAVLDVEGQLYRTENGLVYTAPCELVRQGGYRGVTVASISMQSDVVPLTPGREFVEEPLWNFWTETRGIYANDRRHDLDTTAYSGSFLAGFDREIAQGTVAGISGSFETSRSEGFNENLETKAYGMSIGPYIAHRISPEWAVEGSLGYMLLHNDLSVVVLDGSYLSHQLSGATALNGQYRYDEWTFRPRFGLSYAETFVEDYDLSGAIAGNPVTVNVGSDHFGYGEAEMSGEVSTVRVLSDDLIGMPYAELGLHYAFLRPNDGEILSGNLTYEDTSPVSGTLRGGMRFVYDDEIFFDVGAGYLSIGQNGLDVWEATAKVSFAF